MFPPRKFLLSSFILAALHVTAAPLWDAKDPEQLRFITSRCMEDWYPKAKNPKAALQNWLGWKLEPSDDQATQCYTKCVLEKIGFYEPGEKRFKGVRVMQQWETFHKYLNADREKVHDLTSTFDFIPPLKSSSCSEVFEAFKKVNGKHSETIRAILFGKGESSKKYYQEKGVKIKQKEQSLFMHCEALNYPKGSPQRKDLCGIRKYQMGSGIVFERHMECIFKGLRYMTSKNELDVDEIARDFIVVKKKPDAMKAMMKTCKANLKEKNPGKIAVHYYKCLMNDSKVTNDFKEAFDYREVRSKDYFAALTGKLKPYSRSDVRKQVDDIDKIQCS
ncbi:AAEL006417-PA [Aedes aegypti]|uniref:Long form salivary protein D7L2 n=1 Tax=Aedes aegypti TaxID=7159 RepID=D7L2_AEDAE|nr:37 kDa salivary gland allergen Aed a 2-like [Aedes aegypti]ABM68615.1 AAEL006417-PA [Aedes aegypti]EAT41993.1 AAEL006417-PA [Aedes aegypti]